MLLVFLQYASSSFHAPIPAIYNKTPIITENTNPITGLSPSMPLKTILIFSIYGMPSPNILSAIFTNASTGAKAPNTINTGAIIARHGIIIIPEKPAML